MTRILSADYLRSATALDECPADAIPEVAFAGRSNVGKSSMINALTRRKKLVRVSNTPGRTRMLNFFEVSLEARGRRQRVRLCDLPGYGYARVSKTERAAWHALVDAYLTEREQLRGAVVIVDAEVGPTSDDLRLVELLLEGRARIIVAATKADRVAKSRLGHRIEEIRRQLELPEGVVEPFSSVERLGVDELWGRILEACATPVTSRARAGTRSR